MAFDLASITCARSTRSPRTVIYGDSGLGKTTFAAGAPNPIFVSPGHRISLRTAVELVTACTRFRVPEPVRQADLQSRELSRQWVAATTSTSA